MKFIMTEQYPEPKSATTAAGTGTDWRPLDERAEKRYEDTNLIPPGTSSAGLPTVPWAEPE